MKKNSSHRHHAPRGRLNAVLHSLPGALIVTDEHERVTFMNQASEKLFGHAPAESEGQPVRSLIDNPTVHAQLDALASVETSLPAFDVALQENNRLLRARFSILQSPGGFREGIVLLFNDVTRERELDLAKNEFIATAAHELRTPLTSILGFAELLKQEDEIGPLSQEQRSEAIDHILQTGEALTLIVNDLLDLGRMESGAPARLEKATWELGELLERAVAPFRRAGTRHQFAVIRPAERIVVCADRIRVLQVLDNLLTNAVKYSPGGGRIDVAVTASGSEALVEVSDQGIGMTAEQLNRMFEKFYRADSSETAVAGMGLGMSIARGIVEAHQGRIWARSTLGEGTQVSFTLPLLRREPIIAAEQSRVMEKAPMYLKGQEVAGESHAKRLEKLLDVMLELARAGTLEQIMTRVRTATRAVTGAEGATFILREGEYSYYADEDAISPLFKGKKFPLTQCIGGWAILNRAPVTIQDIEADPRIPPDVYTSTFVKSLAIVPIGSKSPVAAIGAYWTQTHAISAQDMELLQRLADAVAVSMENAQRLEAMRPSGE